MEDLILELNTQYNDIIKLSKYKTNIQLLSSKKGKDGKYYDKWVFPQTKDPTPGQKAIPQQVLLGTDIKTAIENTEIILSYLKEHSGSPQTEKTSLKDDIPF